MRSQPVADWYSGLEFPDEEFEDQKQALEQVIPGVSPGALLNAMEDPTVFPEIARGDLYVQMARLRLQGGQQMSSTARLEYIKVLAKMGRVEAPEKDVIPFASAPGIHIHFPGSGGSVSISASRDERDITPLIEES